MQVYIPDPDLPALDILFDPVLLAETLQPEILKSSLPLSIESIRYKPRTSCLVTYRCHSTDEGQASKRRLHIKAFRNDDWPTRRENVIAQISDPAINDAYAFVAFPFPVDTALPSLQTFWDQPDQFLQTVLFQNSSFGGICNSSILAYKPNRRLTAGLKFESGKQVVLKLHDADSFERGIQSSKILKQSNLVTPSRLGRSNRHRAFAYEWIDGWPLKISNTHQSGGSNLMEMLLDYLDQLHVPLDPSVKRYTTENVSESISAIADYLAEIYPPLKVSARQAADSIISQRVRDVPSRLIHGDFHERQILLTGNGVQACDFDNACAGDSTSDLANFVAHLRYRACVGEISNSLVDQFDEQATRHFKNDWENTSVERYEINRVASLFRLITHPFRLGRDDWIAEVEDLLALVQKQLDSIARQSNIIRLATSNGLQRSLPTGDLTVTSETSKPDAIKKSIAADPGMGFLKTAFQAACVLDTLHRDAPQLSSVYGDYLVANVIARRHKPGRRCLLEFELITDLGPRSILGKVSAKRLDRRTFKAQRALWKHYGFGSQPPGRQSVQVPRPLGACSDWQMWLQEKVVAVPGADILRDNRLDSVASRIAESIAKLHQSDFRPKRQHSIEDELTFLKIWLNEFVDAVPAEHERIKEILRKCRLLKDSINLNHAVAVHRDFYHDQIMFSGQATFLVDLDLLAVGHPALDVGNFLAHLTEHGIREFGDADYWDSESREIVKHYLAAMPSVRHVEIDIFQALALARHIWISWSRSNRRHACQGIIEKVVQMLQALCATKAS